MWDARIAHLFTMVSSMCLVPKTIHRSRGKSKPIMSVIHHRRSPFPPIPNCLRIFVSPHLTPPSHTLPCQPPTLPFLTANRRPPDLRGAAAREALRRADPQRSASEHHRRQHIRRGRRARDAGAAGGGGPQLDARVPRSAVPLDHRHAARPELGPLGIKGGWGGEGDCSDVAERQANGALFPFWTERLPIFSHRVHTDKNKRACRSLRINSPCS